MSPSSTALNWNGQYRVFGYILNEEVLLQFALKHRLGTDENDWQRSCAINRAAEDILDSNHIDPFLIEGVMIKGKFRLCAAIATQDPLEPLPMPARETIEKLKRVMSTDKEPRWYRRA